jgi:hypothetical protein
MLDIDSFISTVAHGGMRSNLFTVTVNSPYGDKDDFSFKCKAATIPQKNTGVISIPYMGRDYKVPGDTTFDAWNTTVFADEQLLVRKTFEDWMDAINNAELNTSVNSNAFAHMVNGTITTYSRDGSVANVYEIRGLFPSTIGEISLDWSTKDTVAEFPVTFNYQYYTRIQ